MKKINLVLPKGRIFDQVKDLLAEAGISLTLSGRGLRPATNKDDLIVKIMKPRNIANLLAFGRHDIGFSGEDWIMESEVSDQITTILPLGLNPVKIVAAIPENYSLEELKNREIIVVSEYKKIATDWLDKQGFNYKFLTVHGATEVYPPEDADMIIDNTSTGNTLRDNNLKIVGTLVQSATNFVASNSALDDPWKHEKIMEMKMLFEAILLGRNKSMIEMNIPNDKKEIIDRLPCLKSPTVMPLARDAGYAVKITLDTKDVPDLLPKLKKWGACDILEYNLSKVIL